MLETNRYHIKYPAGTDLVKDASTQFRQMAESIDDNIDTLPAKVTADLQDSTRRAEQAAAKAEQASASVGRLADQTIAGFVNDTSSATRQSLDLHYVKVFEHPILVTIGDSYASPTDNRSWAVQLAGLLGADLHNYAWAGSGYLTAADHNFQAQADQAARDTSYDHNRVQYVVIAGGRNDIGDTKAISQAISQTAGTLANAFPHARIIFVPMLWDWKPCGGYWRSAEAAGTQLAGISRRSEFIPWAHTWLLGYNTYFSGTDIHPNAEGSMVIANYIRLYIEGKYHGRYASAVVKAPGNTGLWALSITGNGGMVSYSMGVADRVTVNQVQSFSIPLWAATSNDMSNDGYPGWSTLITSNGDQAALFHVDTVSTQDASAGPVATAGVQPYNIATHGAPLGRMGGSFTRAW